jgi:hypothetical protein
VESLDPASLSICEERSCHALDALADADPVDDWLCAASSAFRVAGDIGEPEPKPETGAELVEAGLAISNGSTALKPLDGGEEELDGDAFDEVSALTASSTAVAAPRANSMA